MDDTGEKYTQARRAVLGDAATGASAPLYVEEAQRLEHRHIGCEHLLLGILADRGGATARILAAHDVTLEVVRRRVAELCGAGEGGSASKRLSWTPRATVVRRLADIEAERLGEVRPRDPHLLLAILTEGEGVPNHLLNELGVDVAKLRSDLLDALEVPTDLRDSYLRQRTAVEQARRPPKADRHRR